MANILDRLPYTIRTNTANLSSVSSIGLGSIKQILDSSSPSTVAMMEESNAATKSPSEANNSPENSNSRTRSKAVVDNNQDNINVEVAPNNENPKTSTSHPDKRLQQDAYNNAAGIHAEDSNDEKNNIRSKNPDASTAMEDDIQEENEASILTNPTSPTQRRMSNASKNKVQNESPSVLSPQISDAVLLQYENEK